MVVRVDKRRFARVLANLLDNADKYAGGATEVTLELRGEVVQIAIEDRGNGVPEAEREVIFDRFSRGSESGNRASDSGVGLGLALVDEHVRLHGGQVWVEDRRDGQPGARFVVELPGGAPAHRRRRGRAERRGQRHPRRDDPARGDHRPVTAAGRRRSRRPDPAGVAWPSWRLALVVVGWILRHPHRPLAPPASPRDALPAALAPQTTTTSPSLADGHRRRAALPGAQRGHHAQRWLGSTVGIRHSPT